MFRVWIFWSSSYVYWVISDNTMIFLYPVTQIDQTTPFAAKWTPVIFRWEAWRVTTLWALDLIFHNIQQCNSNSTVSTACFGLDFVCPEWHLLKLWLCWIATEAHGKTRNKIEMLNEYSVFFRVLPWPIEHLYRQHILSKCHSSLIIL